MRFSTVISALVLTATAHAAQLEVLTITSATLRGNPLGDPVTRRVAIFKPDAVKDAPLVVYLPGWGGSSEDAIGLAADDLFGTSPRWFDVSNVVA